MSQVTGEVPGGQHEPWQVSHSIAVSTSMSRCVPKIDLVEVDLDADERVLAALAARPRAAASAAAAPKNVSKMSPNPPKSPAPPNPAWPPPRSYCWRCFGVAQHVVGVGDLLEALGCLGARVHVGVQLAGEPTVRLLDLVGGRVACDAEHLVMVGHTCPFDCRMPVGCDGRLSQLSPSVRER